MAPTPQPFAFAGTLQLAADQSLPQDPIPFNVSSQYVALQKSLLSLTGTGTVNVPFGSISAPGAKGLAIRYDSGQVGAAAVQVTINGGSQPLEVTPGGFIVWINPTPAAGVTAVSIAYTASCQLNVWVLG
jgi:hypothetical protein